MGEQIMDTRDKLLEIVGAGNFSDDPTVLKKYVSDFSLVPPGAPSCMVKPKDAQEVQKILRYANEQALPVVPVSSSRLPRKRGPYQYGIRLWRTHAVHGSRLAHR